MVRPRTSEPKRGRTGVRTTEYRGQGPADVPVTERSADPGADADPQRWPWVKDSAGSLLQATIFGLLFGFLLQKGGVAKFDILVGVLLLENFVVVQVMLSAIIVGMIGVYLLERAGIVKPQIKETVYGSNILGGLIFGVGFGLIAYCPGTDAAAVGQGNLDAIVGILGMAFGSYLFALSSKFTRGTVSKWGNRGKITLADLFGLSRGVIVAVATPLLVGVLVALEMFFGS